jgi:hypothetical protein
LAVSRFSSNGPDATDVSVMLAALEGVHEVNVSLTISHAGVQGGGGLSVVAIATSRRALPSGVMRSVSRRHHFPNANSKTLEGTLYRLLTELDYDCSSFWQQETIERL